MPHGTLRAGCSGLFGRSEYSPFRLVARSCAFRSVSSRPDRKPRIRYLSSFGNCLCNRRSLDAACQYRTDHDHLRGLREDAAHSGSAFGRPGRLRAVRQNARSTFRRQFESDAGLRGGNLYSASARGLHAADGLDDQTPRLPGEPARFQRPGDLPRSLVSFRFRVSLLRLFVSGHSRDISPRGTGIDPHGREDSAARTDLPVE